MDIEQRIRASVDVVKANGFTVVYQDWGHINRKCACPMACVILQDNPNSDIMSNIPQASVKAAELLHVSDTWVDSFTDGFDAEDLNEATHIKNAYELGKKFREELNPVNYWEYMNNHELI